MNRSGTNDGLALTASLVVLAALLLLFHTARVESGDALQLYDAATSMARHGDTLFDEANWFGLPQLILADDDESLRGPAGVEPVSIGLLSQFYRLADYVPGVGYVHWTWLFNGVALLLVAAAFYGLVRALGYSPRVAVIATLLLALATALFPYGRTLFRDATVVAPLTLALLAAVRWRLTTDYRALMWLGLALLATTAAILIKNSAILAIPALMAAGVPGWPSAAQGGVFARRLSAGLWLVLLIVPLAMITLFADLTAAFLIVLGLAESTVGFALEASRAYLLSPGGSLWGTSPILLLGLAGAWYAFRQGELRWLWVPLLAVYGYAFGHAISAGPHWFGGLSWPPRFLIPAIPFALLAALPLLRAIERRPRPWLVAGAAALVIYSLWVQFNAIALDWTQYTKVLPPPDKAIEWWGGLYDLRYLRWFVLPPYWSSVGLDFLYVRTELWLWPVVLGLVAGLGLLSIFLALRQPPRRYRLVWALPLALGLIGWLGLRHFNAHDALYWGGNAALDEALAHVSAHAGPDDWLLLNAAGQDNSYERFFMNANGGSVPRLVSLPAQPGEAGSPLAPAIVSGPNPEALMDSYSLYQLRHIAAGRADAGGRLWLLANNGPFLPWAVRPVEWVLAQRYYPLGEVPLWQADPTVRLLSYVPEPAPGPVLRVDPAHEAGLAFGDSLIVRGYDLPRGPAYRAGDDVLLSLNWSTVIDLAEDYVFTWFVATPSGEVLAQGVDSQPVGGFAPTSSWSPGVPVWDHRALTLPDDASPGEYRLWVVAYRFVDGQPVRLMVTAGEQLDGTIGVLPVTIVIARRTE
jgi:hypothetical protein